MQVLKKISSFVFMKEKQATLIIKKNCLSNSNFKPITRLEKVNNHSNYPSSTDSKLVFLARLDGIGFQEETYPTCPEHIPIEQMIREINVVCQKQWQLIRK